MILKPTDTKGYQELTDAMKEGKIPFAQKVADMFFGSNLRNGVREFVFDQKHEPSVAIFDVGFQKIDRPLAFQRSENGTWMALLTAGDAAITPWFPSSTGLNGGAVRTV